MQIFLGLIAYLTASAVLVGGLLFAAMLYVAVPEQQRSASSATRIPPAASKVTRTAREPDPAPQTDRQASAPAAEPAATPALEVGAAQALASAPPMATPAPIAVEPPAENAAKQKAAERAKARKEARRQAKRKAQRAIAARQRDEQQWVDRQWDGRPPLGYAGRYTERRSNFRDGGIFPFFRD